MRPGLKGKICRERFHESLRRRADALLERNDGILTAGSVPSPPHLNLASVHRRGWGSLYAVLSKGKINGYAVRKLLARHPMDHDEHNRPPVCETWPEPNHEHSCDDDYGPVRVRVWTAA